MDHMYRNARQAYSSAQFEGMSPGKLVLALYNGAFDAIKKARQAIKDGVIPVRGEQISKAIAIISELECALDHDNGGEVAQNLASLYDYMTARLLRANVDADDAALGECENILGEIRDGWQEMIATHGDQAVPAPTAEEPTQESTVASEPAPKLAGYL